MNRSASLLAALLVLGMPISAFGVVLTYAEPPDLTPNLAIPDNLGSVDLGLNSVSGTISCDNGNFGFCFLPPDDDEADAFEFSVPAGLVVDTIELIITDFQSTLNAEARVRNFSGGTSVHFIDSDTTFANLVNVPGGLTAGLYDLQIHSVFDLDPGLPGVDIGSVSLSYVFNITASSAVPAPATLALLGLGLAGIGLRRRRYRS